MERYYQIAGICFRISGDDTQLFKDDGLLTQYRIGRTDVDQDIHMETVKQLAAPEGVCVYSGNSKKVYYREKIQIRYEGVLENCWDNVYLRICRAGQITKAQFLPRDPQMRISPYLALMAMELEHQLVQHRGILLHSSYIRVGDEAILFTAPSGTGKSTQAELWRRLRRAEIINGDRAAVILDPEGPTVYGVPYAGSSGISKNVALKLKAIICLSQEPITTIEKRTGLAAFRPIWEGCCVNIWNRHDMGLCMDTLMELITKVPVYHLACTPDESAVIAVEKKLWG